MYKIQFSDTALICLCAVRFDSPTRNPFEIFLRAQRALEFLHSQDPKQTSVSDSRVEEFTAASSQHMFDPDWQVADAAAGCMKHCIGDRRGHAGQ